MPGPILSVSLGRIAPTILEFLLTSMIMLVTPTVAGGRTLSQGHQFSAVSVNDVIGQLLSGESYRIFK